MVTTSEHISSSEDLDDCIEGYGNAAELDYADHFGGVVVDIGSRDVGPERVGH